MHRATIILFMLAAACLAQAGTGTGTGAEPVGPEGWRSGPSRAGVLLIETIDTALGEALSRLDVAHDTYYGDDFTALDLAGYRHVFLGLDGGIIEEASIARVAAFAEGGGFLHLYGGSCDFGYAAAVNTHLVHNNTANYCWSQPTGSPDVAVANAGHYLAAGLPATFDFTTSGASYYQLRITGDDVAVAARNGDGVPALAARRLGVGRFDICINSPGESWYTDPTDMSWLTQVVANMLSVETSAPEVLLLTTTTDAVGAALDDLGVGYDWATTADFTTFELGAYRQVFAALDGGVVDFASVSALASFAQAGGALHLLGGTAMLVYVQAVNGLLIGNNTSEYLWAQSPATPHSLVTDAGHYLTRELPAAHTFANVAATYHQLRITDPTAEVAAINSAGRVQLAAKELGAGRFDVCTNSPYTTYYGGADVVWITTVVRNMLDAAGPRIRAVADVPNDQGRQVRLSWARDLDDDAAAADPVIEYAVYRRIDPLQTAGAAAADLGTRYPPGDWEFLHSVPADREAAYAIIAPTLADSTLADGDHDTVFFVRARTATAGVYRDSTPTAGSSVDNLAPNVPTGLMVFYGAANLLTWHPSADADFRYFKVYRDDGSGFYQYLFSTTNTAWIDGGGGYDDRYLVSAVDFAGNESAGAEPGMITDADDAPVLHTALYRNAPNPFNPATTIRYELARTGRVDLVVLDVSGREIRRLIDGETVAAGRRATVWDGRDASGREAAAGLYFYRLTTEDFSGTGRMMLVK